MAVFYLDTSALAKRYALEDGTAQIAALTDPVAGHDLYTVRLTGPEMISALFRKAHTGGITTDDAADLAKTFRADWQTQYNIVEVTAAVSDRAMDLAQLHGLRGYDAVHLAAALALNDIRRGMQLLPLTFVSSDAEQLEAAVAEGLAVENPTR